MVTQRSPSALERHATRWRAHVEEALGAAIGEGDPASLYDAMRYAALGPGKRLRPLLVLAACEALGGDPTEALPAAAAIELVHAFSLVHDDLPCMDDDDLRRGRPTCHKVYGEAVAMLAGDALLARAMGLLASQRAPWAAAAACELADAVSAGMVPGQVLDIAPAPGGDLERLHALKTGRLFVSACRLGALVAGADPRALELFATRLGLAFQIADDMADAGEEGRETYVSRHGLGGARERCLQVLADAQVALGQFGEEGEALRALARFVAGSVSGP